MKTRRDFLRDFLGLLALGAVSQWELLTLQGQAREKDDDTPTRFLEGELSGKRYKIHGWTGDNPTVGHEFRDREFPQFPEQVEHTYDFVVVGGGVAGLSSAYFLSDHDVLLLEQYDELGGQSRGGSFSGLDYSYGAAMISQVEGIYGQLYEKLGIQAKRLPEEHNSIWWHNKWSLAGKGTGDLAGMLEKLAAQCATVLKSLPPDDSPEKMDSPDVVALDGASFASFLNDYSDDFRVLLDTVCRATSCGTINMTSAAAGFRLVSCLSSPAYVFKGGNAAISRALIGALLKSGPQDRLRTGSFVWQIDLNETGAQVKFTDAQGHPHRVACRHVVVAVPPLVAWRLFSNLTDKMRASLMPFRYGSYLVANLLMRRKKFDPAYNNWLGGNNQVSDIIVAETSYQLSGEYKSHQGSVLTVYQPWAPGTAGRHLLYKGDRAALSQSVLEQVGELAELAASDLEEIVLTRWGHAMPVPTIGYYGKLRKIIANYAGPYSFAYGATQGISSAESAIRGARFAADRALSQSSKTSVIVPALTYS